MAFPIADWVVSLFFLFVLILVSRFKEQIGAVDRDSRRNIEFGVVILSAVALAQVYAKLGTLSSIPFVSDPTFFQLLTWIGYIAGMILLISGVSSWLPLARENRRRSAVKIRRLDFIKKIEQLVKVEHRIDTVLTATLEQMLDHFEISAGAAFKRSPRTGEIALVGQTSDLDADCGDLQAVRFDKNRWDRMVQGTGRNDTDLLVEVPDAVGRPNLVLTVVFENKPVAFFTVWTTESESLDKEDLVNLRIAMDIISTKISVDRLSAETSFYNRARLFGDRLIESVREADAPKDKVAAISSQLSEHIQYDYFSIALINERRDRIRRFSTGVTGTVLEEVGLPAPERSSLMGTVFATGNETAIERIDSYASPQVDSLLVNSGMKSCLAMPVTIGGQARGVVTLASRTTSQYGNKDASMMSYAMPALVELAVETSQREATESAAKRMMRMTRFARELGETKTDAESYRQAAAILHRELKTSMVRISEVEDEGNFLKSFAMETIRSIEGIVPRDGRMILSLMPWHQLVIESGRQVITNQEDPDCRLAPAESRQAMTEQLKSALIVPVKVADEVVGVISIGEMRNWRRFKIDNDDVLFAGTVAEMLGQTIEARRSEEEAQAEGYIESRDVRTRLNSSLTGILGSVEILKSAQRDEASVDRYLGIIDKSAHRIHDCLKEETVRA